MREFVIGKISYGSMSFLFTLNHSSDKPLITEPVSISADTVMPLLNLISTSGHFNICLLISSSYSCSRSFLRSGNNMLTLLVKLCLFIKTKSFAVQGCLSVSYTHLISTRVSYCGNLRLDVQLL